MSGKDEIPESIKRKRESDAFDIEWLDKQTRPEGFSELYQDDAYMDALIAKLRDKSLIAGIYGMPKIGKSWLIFQDVQRYVRKG